MIRAVTDLEIYNLSLDLLKEIYSLCQKFPSSERSLDDQIKRAAKSIPANIAEGFAKRISPKEFKRFLTIALGSSDEVVTHLRTSNIVLPFLKEQSTVLLEKYIVLSKRINKLRSNWLTGTPTN